MRGSASPLTSRPFSVKRMRTFSPARASFMRRPAPHPRQHALCKHIREVFSIRGTRLHIGAAFDPAGRIGGYLHSRFWRVAELNDLRRLTATAEPKTHAAALLVERAGNRHD